MSNAEDQPIINFEGSLVALGPLRRELIPVYTRWRNDFSAAKTLDFSPAPFTVEEREVWYERAHGDSSVVRFTVYERSSWRPIGIANLHQIDFQHGTAELGLAIGEAQARGHGFGTEAAHLMLDYAFTALGLHSVMLRVYSYNPAAIRAYQNAGFREFGRRSRSRRWSGKRWDEVYMECLASEFESPVLGRVLAPDEPSASA